jgi:hypothetical protein
MKKVLLVLLPVVVVWVVGIVIWSKLPPDSAPLREGGLNFEKSVFAKVYGSGKVDILQKPEFEKGQAVNFALMNVGPFKKDADGKDWVDMDMKVFEGRRVIFEHKSLLGDQGHVALKNDMAESPSGVFTATASLKPGDYTLQLLVYDKIGGGKVRDSGVFTVVE